MLVFKIYEGLCGNIVTTKVLVTARSGSLVIYLQNFWGVIFGTLSVHITGVPPLIMLTHLTPASSPWLQLCWRFPGQSIRLDSLPVQRRSSRTMGPGPLPNLAAPNGVAATEKYWDVTLTSAAEPKTGYLQNKLSRNFILLQTYLCLKSRAFHIPLWLLHLRTDHHRLYPTGCSSKLLLSPHEGWHLQGDAPDHLYKHLHKKD